MAETKIYISDELDAQLRAAAMRRFGYGRGSISKAAEEAVTQWLAREDAVRGVVEALVQKAKGDQDVVAVLLFGSYARREPAYEDLDVAIVTTGSGRADLLAYEGAVEQRGALRGLAVDVLDFRSLPVDMQRRVLNEAEVLYARDQRELRAVAAEVAGRWNDFEPTYRYLVA